MKAHKVCILWNLLKLSYISYKKICIIIEMVTFLAQFIDFPPRAV